MRCTVHALHFTLSKKGCAWEAMDIMICLLFKRTTLDYCVKNGPKEGKVGSRGASLGQYFNTDRLLLIVLCFIVLRRCYVFHKLKALHQQKMTTHFIVLLALFRWSWIPVSLRCACNPMKDGGFNESGSHKDDKKWS